MPFSFRNIATNLGSSIVTNAVSNAVFGRSGRGGSSDYSSLKQTLNLGPLGMKNLRYPLDVEAAPGLGNQGHYIMFFINQQTRSELEVGRGTGHRGSTGMGDTGFGSLTSGNYNSKRLNGLLPMYGLRLNSKATGALLSGGKAKKVNQNNKAYSANKIVAANLIEGSDKGAFDKKAYLEKIEGGFKDQNLNAPPAGAGESTVFVKRKATKRLNTAITMYMPTGVKATYGANYQDVAIGSGARFAADLYSDVMAGKDAASSILETLEKDFPQAVRESMILGALKLAESVPGFQGATDVLGMATGEVIAERLELAFRNINKRKFQYTFKMLPKSLEEAEMVHEIVLAFKKHMSASFKDGNRSGKTLVVPDTFNIEYLYNGEKNQYLHQISECVLETVDVSYGGDRYKTFHATEKGAPPVETTMSLNFAELELISRERIEEGF